MSGGWAWTWGWNEIHQIIPPGRARFADGAKTAARLPGGTDQGTELHQGLIKPRAITREVDARLGRGCRGGGGKPGGVLDESFGQVPEEVIRGFLTGIIAHAEKPREDTHDIAIEERRGLVEGDATNGAGGVAADAWQGQDLVKCVRELAVTFRDQPLRGLLEIASAAVVAETGPQREHFFRWGGGQRCEDGGKSKTKLCPVFASSFANSASVGSW